MINNTCPCFPGTCRGDVVNGYTVGGQRCKATIPSTTPPYKPPHLLPTSLPHDRTAAMQIVTDECDKTNTVQMVELFLFLAKDKRIGQWVADNLQHKLDGMHPLDVIEAWEVARANVLSTPESKQ